MLAWLSDWLRDIIAVILLAVIVELLLPNKVMQRYTRLVVGLFILLTILSPILKLIQSDISAKLDEGMELWSEAEMSQSAQMTGLSQIQENAEQLTEQRELEAAKLTERTLEETMRSELIERTKAPVDTVDAELKWVVQSGMRTPYIGQVTVTLLPTDKQGGPVTGSAPVEDVLPVDVAVGVEIDRITGNDAEQNQSEEVEVLGATAATDKKPIDDERWLQAEPETTTAVNGLLLQGWGVAADNIIVRQPAGQTASR